MKNRLIANPVSGVDAALDYLSLINASLIRHFGPVDITLTAGPGDAETAAERSAADGYDHIFVAGGDGTLNEVLNGVAKVTGAMDRTQFGLIPLGTGNDFARAIGLSEDVEETLKIIASKNVRTVDVGVLNDRLFINVSAGGFIAEVSYAVNPDLKSLAGKFAYLVGGAQVLFEYEPVQALMHLVLDDQSKLERLHPMQMFAVCNSRFIGGGHDIAPLAVNCDGLLDVCVVESMPLVDFLTLLPKLSAGTHLDDDSVHYYRVSSLKISFDRTTTVNTDGEVLEAAVCSYHVLPRAVRFYCGNTEMTQPTPAGEKAL
jgi:diacylglycerol kinase (ATP)